MEIICGLKDVVIILLRPEWKTGISFLPAIVSELERY